MTSIGAPQCRHTKVGLWTAVIGAAIAGLSGRRRRRLMQKLAGGVDVFFAASISE